MTFITSYEIFYSKLFCEEKKTQFLIIILSPENHREQRMQNHVYDFVTPETV